jgi:RNA polymerase sigma factor (sigma-70 family)
LTIAEQTDAELIRGSLEKPEEFQYIFRRHFTSVYRYLARRVGTGAAEDMAAQVFVDAFRNRAAYDPAYESARPWLFGIASNEVRRRSREEKRRLRAYARTLVAESEKLDLSPDADDRRLQPELAAALAALDARDRDVFLLFVLAELSYEEIAVALKIPVGTVCSRISRVRRQIRKRLGAQDVADPRNLFDAEPIATSKESAWTSVN